MMRDNHKKRSKLSGNFQKSPYLVPSPFKSDGGELIGQVPVNLSTAEIEALGHEKSNLKAIRAKCLDCCNDQPSEVRKCVAFNCPSWLRRMGSNPMDPRFKTNEKYASEALERSEASENQATINEEFPNES